MTLLPALLDTLSRAGVGVVIVGSRDGVPVKLHVNSAAIDRLGYDVSEWEAQPFLSLVHADHRARVAQLYERLIAGAELPMTVEITFVHRDGTPVHGEFMLGRTEIDDTIALVLVARDISSPLGAQLSLLEADRLSLVGAMSAGFAHEINNPLTSVVLNLRSLRKQIAGGLADPALALRCVDDVTLAAERIASNVRALQTLATRSASDQVDLAAVVTSALRLAAPTLEPKAQVVRRIVAGTRVGGEESRIGQAVLAMLLFSSSGFPDTGGPFNEIVVAVEPRSERVVVEVSDNGRALTPEEATHAFDPFFRSPSRGAGVGVGLGIARSVATNLGGDVALAPRDGGGAVITMTLPPA